MSKINKRQYVSFDWAMKRLLRSKANYDVLNGFLSELMSEAISIEDVLESESNREYELDKANRVDLLARDSNNRRIIVEVQYRSEIDYYQRMLYGASKVVTESIVKGKPYADIAKVISVNLIYFHLGQGTDYVYCGETCFIGRHKKDKLQLSESQKTQLDYQSIKDIFPTYYILRINDFDDIAKDGLDEWIYFLKNEELPGKVSARGLRSAAEKLSFMNLNEADRLAYESYEKDLHTRASELEFSIKRAERAEQKLEEANQREEEERRQKEEERRQKEALQDVAIKALMATGKSRDEAIQLLNINKTT